jgi:hypothetical protein
MVFVANSLALNRGKLKVLLKLIARIGSIFVAWWFECLSRQSVSPLFVSHS